ncbi:MAG: YkgJ family cysteine cluster protein [Humidesulfovibrio sp.]
MDAHPSLPQRRLTITLDRQGGEVLALGVLLPAAPAIFADILPAVRAVADALQDEARRTLAGLGQKVSCGGGCDTCCSHLVMLGEAEALALLGTLRALPPDLHSRVAERFRVGIERLESAGLMPDLYAAFTRQAHDARLLARMQAAYWALGIPCPFLEGGLCAVYDERPLVCRQYAMTSPPAACRTPFSAETALVKVLPPLDLAGAAAGFDGLSAHASRVLPLLLCLLRQAHLDRRAYPVLEPEPMLARFLDFAAGHYARKEHHP